jgi:hypothetical protein
MIATRPTYATPFHDLFRPLTADERQDLRASIKEHGVQVPVTVYQSAEHGPAIIDGMNRWSVCQELGVDCPVNDLGAIEDGTAGELAEQLNHCRRHLAPKEWHEVRSARAERIKRIADSRADGKSTRTMAAEEGISEKMVRNDLDAAAAAGILDEPETVTGKDGRPQRSTKKRQPSPAARPSRPPVPDSNPTGPTRLYRIVRPVGFESLRFVAVVNATVDQLRTAAATAIAESGQMLVEPVADRPKARLAEPHEMEGW